MSLRLDRDQALGPGRTWVVRPIDGFGVEYTLRVTLPTGVEQRVFVESDRRRQSSVAKNELGGRLDIFWDPQFASDSTLLLGPRLFRLNFASMDLSDPRPER